MNIAVVKRGPAASSRLRTGPAGLDPIIRSTRKTSTRTVVQIGCGNIGSQHIDLLARMDGVREVHVVDPDVCGGDIRKENILPAHFGRPKAEVHAQRLRAIRSDLRVVPHVARVEDVPLGVLRADVIVACLDSRRARQYVNQASRWLGVPWIDAAVDANSMLARVNVYRPLGDLPCYECSWSDADYALVEQVYPCQIGQTEKTYATNAPAHLGALAAAMQSIECRKVLAGDWEHAAVATEVLLDAMHHRHHATRFRLNPACRCDHRRWTINELPKGPGGMTLRRALELGKRASRSPSFALKIPEKSFVSTLVCTKCPWQQRRLHLDGRDSASRTCPRCAAPTAGVGFDRLERLDESNVSAAALDWPLRRFGLRGGDILAIVRKGEGAGTRHYQLACDRM